ncbi:MAG: hypothetical protein R3C13_04150 [Hyphomonas sp.]|uniref:hypothetical protein n=1 Tax=Hyphomonas sp. TaxID=87 RepID=UPI00352981EA
MSKGTLLTNNWLLGAVAVAILIGIALVASLQGHMAVELAGLELSVAPHEDGGLRVALARAGGSGLLPL